MREPGSEEWLLHPLLPPLGDLRLLELMGLLVSIRGQRPLAPLCTGRAKVSSPCHNPLSNERLIPHCLSSH